MARILEKHVLLMEAFQSLRTQFLIGLELLQLSGFDLESDASTILPQRVPCNGTCSNELLCCHVEPENPKANR